MASRVFHEIFLHLTWHVKGDGQLLTANVEPKVHEIITERCRKMKGVYLHGINGTETHIHLAVNIEPQVQISDLVKDLKGGSSHDFNSHSQRNLLYWQRGYGVVSFGKKDLEWVLKYLANQKDHHARKTTFDRLEQIGEED